MVDEAREGGVEEEARKVIELRLRWIWNPWSGARESAGDSELAHSPSMATREGEGEERKGVNGSEAGGELGKAAWSTWRRHRRPGNRDRPPRRQAQRWGASGELGPLLRRAAQGEGRRVYDRWGPCVRKFLYLNPNFWIVTILPPKRNLVPRFRRKVPNRKEVGNYIPWYNWSNSGHLD